jgi:hypothetical protein
MPKIYTCLVAIAVVIALAGCASVGHPGVIATGSTAPTPTPTPTPTVELVTLPDSLGFAQGTKLTDDIEISVWPHLVDAPGWSRTAGFAKGDLAFAHDGDGCLVNINVQTSSRTSSGTADEKKSRALINKTYKLTAPFASSTVKIAREGGGTVTFLTIELFGTGKTNKSATGYAIARTFGATGSGVLIEVLCDGKGAKKLFTTEVKPRLVMQFARQSQ